MSVAFLFPGQGSSREGMGRELARRSAGAREVFERVDAALGRPLSALCFADDPAPLTLTENQQPAVLAVSLASLAEWRDLGKGEPDMAAGHSLGEYSALVCAGALELEDAARVVELRGRLMQRSVPVGEGGMSAVLGLESAGVGRVCKEMREEGYRIWAANFNGGKQTVVSGLNDALGAAVPRLKEAGARRIVPLDVSAPFHTPLMESAARDLRVALGEISWKTPRIPVISNVDAKRHTDARSIPERLICQVTSPVLWEESVMVLAAAGATRTVEFEPGEILSGLVRRINGDIA